MCLALAGAAPRQVDDPHVLRVQGELLRALLGDAA